MRFGQLSKESERESDNHYHGEWLLPKTVHQCMARVPSLEDYIVSSRYAQNSQVPDMSLIFLPLQEQDSFESIGEIIASASIDNRGL